MGVVTVQQIYVLNIDCNNLTKMQYGCVMN